MARQTSPHTEYILGLLRSLRRANERAEAASTLWGEISGAINARLDREGIAAKWLRTRERKESLDLASAFDEWHFWQRESVRLSSTILAEESARRVVTDNGKSVEVVGDHVQ
jgi:hypothetical protein